MVKQVSQKKPSTTTRSKSSKNGSTSLKSSTVKRSLSKVALPKEPGGLSKAEAELRLDDLLYAHKELNDFWMNNARDGVGPSFDAKEARLQKALDKIYDKLVKDLMK